LNKEHT